LTIAKYLEKTYPDTPILFPPRTLALLSAFHVAYFQTVHSQLWNLVCCAVCYRLNPRSQEYYRRTREESEGKKLEEIRGEQEWAEAESAFGKLDSWMNMNGEGQEDYVMGEGVCYADVQIAGALMWAKTALGADSKEWARMCSWHGGKWKRIVANFAQYSYVDV
jgi:glutathione S-transferase